MNTNAYYLVTSVLLVLTYVKICCWAKQAACFAVARPAKHIEQTDDYGNIAGNGIAFYGAVENKIQRLGLRHH